jgi:hypothetical protein
VVQFKKEAFAISEQSRFAADCHDSVTAQSLRQRISFSGRVKIHVSKEKGREFMVAAEIKRKISNVNEKDVVQLAVELGNITAPAGYEQPVADYVENWFRAQGFHAFQQNLCEKRSNAIGSFKGAGGGHTLVFNSHMDSDQGRPRFHGEPIPLGPKVRIEGRRIFGKTVQNDRGRWQLL